MPLSKFGAKIQLLRHICKFKPHFLRFIYYFKPHLVSFMQLLCSRYRYHFVTITDIFVQFDVRFLYKITLLEVFFRNKFALSKLFLYLCSQIM